MKRSYKLALLLSLVVPFSVNAASEKVTTSEELTKCISENQECTIDSAITVEKITIDGKNVTIDLNGNTLTSTIIVKGKANLTITDSKGNGEVVSSSKGNRTVTVNEGSQFTLENGTIRSLKNDGVAAYSGNFLMNGEKLLLKKWVLCILTVPMLQLIKERLKQKIIVLWEITEQQEQVAILSM